MLRPSAAGALALVAIAALAACSSSKPAAVAPAPSVSVAGGCALVAREAARAPDMRVDELPQPLSMNPAPIRRPVPRGVMKADGSGSVEISVLVDTLGRADMRTFRSKATHPWLAEGARLAVSKWRFAPASVGGCKVPRNYHWRADARPRPARRNAGRTG
jgi:outer membrane biosynthesis protein TonB